MVDMTAGQSGRQAAPASPEQPSAWPMLDLTLPISSGASAARPAPAPYTSSMAASSCRGIQGWAADQAVTAGSTNWQHPVPLAAQPQVHPQ